jgi:hypothetical protein
MSKTFVGFTPHPKQREIISQILSSDAKYHIANIGRQFGKSLMGMNILLYWALNDGPCKIMWVSPVYSQASKVHKELYAAIAKSGIVASNNYSSNELLFKNGSAIIFRSAERYDNIRGETLDYAILDEAAFMKNEAWKEAIKPTLLVRGKRALFISTPKGRNWFYELYQLGVSSDHPNYMSYTGSSYDTPFISQEEIDDAKKTLPEKVFQQEYLAQFIDGGGEVFQNIKDRTYAGDWQRPTGKVYCGIDLGKQEDYTVATFMDAGGTVIDIYRANQIEWSQMVSAILEKIRKWNATVMIEVNSIGDVIFEQVKKNWSDTHPFVTSSKSKQEIIEGLILDFNEYSVLLPGKELFPSLTQELETFTYEYNPKTRNISYGHPSGLHDDTVMSLAISNYCRKTKKTLGTYSYMSQRLRT